MKIAMKVSLKIGIEYERRIRGNISPKVSKDKRVTLKKMLSKS